MDADVKKWLDLQEKRRTEYFKHYRRKKRQSAGWNPIGSLGEFVFWHCFKGCKLVRQRSHDFVWKGDRIEVKTGTLRPDGTWQFQITKLQLEESDMVFLVCLNPQLEPIRIFTIPTPFARILFKNGRLSFSQNSKNEALELFEYKMPES